MNSCSGIIFQGTWLVFMSMEWAEFRDFCKPAIHLGRLRRGAVKVVNFDVITVIIFPAVIF